VRVSDPVKQNKDIYSRDAAKLAQSYNTVSTPDVAPVFAAEMMKLAEKNTLWVADIGCGPGRDSVWLADQGFNVVAVDNSPEMLEKIAERPNILKLQDEAPAMSALKSLGKKFDVVFMSAFLFHLDAPERKNFYENLKEISKPGTYIYATLRNGPVPEGRRMFPVASEELAEFARANGMHCADLGRAADPLGRKNVLWDHVEMRVRQAF
jgi:2-polyprenyl-3-methyl-5-hydroxy-6-metoxy-1,4-benzoquinol methylase